MTHSDYYSQPGFSATAIKAGARSMLEMRAYMTGGIKRDSAAMRWGRLAHALVLEPHTFLDGCRVWEGDRKAGKEWQAFKDEAGEREIVTKAEWNRLDNLRMAVRANADAWRLLEETSHEQAIYWQQFGSPCKALLDGWGPAGVVEVKTTQDVSPRGFSRQFANLGHHLQLAWYKAAAKSTGASGRIPCHVIPVQSEEPFDVAVYKIGSDWLGIGWSECERIVSEYQACELVKRWPGAVDGVADLPMPSWVGGNANMDIVMPAADFTIGEVN